MWEGLNNLRMSDGRGEILWVWLIQYVDKSKGKRGSISSEALLGTLLSLLKSLPVTILSISFYAFKTRRLNEDIIS